MGVYWHRGVCLPLGSLFTGFGTDVFLSRHQLLVEDAVPFAAVGCYLFPVLRVNVQCFHVKLADIFVAQYESTSASLTKGDIFGDAAGERMVSITVCTVVSSGSLY